MVCLISSKLNNAHVITNYVLPTNIEFKSKDNGKLNVLYLSSLMPEKGILNLLDAAKRLPNMRFNICGAGNPKIVEQIESAQNSYNNIHYLGLVKNKIKKNILEQADVFVLQTHYETEGVPLAILEAMSYQLAIITTEHNGIPETVQDSAIYVNKQDTNDLVKKLNSLDKNRDLLIKHQQMAHTCSQSFSFSNFEQKVLNIFNTELKL